MAAAAVSPSHSQPPHHDDEHHSQNQDPNSTQLHPETLDLPNSPQSAGVQHEDTLLILDDDSHQSGTTHPEPILLTDDTSVMSPTNLQRRATKRKTRKTYKRKRPTKKIQNLTDSLNPIPFAPTKKLDLDKHEEVLKRLGLYEFSKIEFDRRFRTDLIVQLIVSYDSKKRGSFVNDVKVNVNRADLARALRLPPAKQEKGSSSVEEVDLDSEVFSDEAIAFIEDFVFGWMILHDDSWIMPTEMVNWTRCIKDGHPEKLDFASLIWYNVEKELSQGDKLVNCYYAPHLQYLIRSQRDSLFEEGDDEENENLNVDEEIDSLKVDEENDNLKVNEENDVLKLDEENDNLKVDEENDNLKVNEENDNLKVNEENDNLKVDEENDNLKVNEENDNMKVDEEKDDKEEHEEEKVSMIEDQNIELTLGTDVEEIEHEEIKEDDETMADVEESKEEMEEQVNFNFLQRCQNSDLNNFEEIKVEDEQIEQVDDEDEGGERLDDEGFDMEANDDDTFDRNGLTDNFLDSHNNPYNSHAMSSMDLFGGPSFYNNNGGKRVMDHEEEDDDMNQNNKRLKTDDVTDISFCFDQMQQLMQKAKMIHESKERSYENLQYNNQMAMNQLQEREHLMEMIIKQKDEELEKKNVEVFRLERELYLMGDLLSGYKKALNDTRYKFSEYRKRFAIREEPLYKDAGPGGLVLSTREIRLKQEEDMMKFQIMVNNFENDCVFDWEFLNDRLLPLGDKLDSMENQMQKLKELAKQIKKNKDDQKSLDEDELSGKNLEENEKIQKSSTVESETTETTDTTETNQKLPEENETELNENKSFESEKNQKSLDDNEEIQNENASSVVEVENDAIMENVHLDADESEEKEGGEEQ